MTWRNPVTPAGQAQTGAPTGRKGLPPRRFSSVMARSPIGLWIAVQILAGFLILPYARLLYYGLDRLAEEFPGSQRWRLLPETRAAYERWRRWCRRRGQVTRFAMFVAAAGASAFFWWLSTR